MRAALAAAALPLVTSGPKLVALRTAGSTDGYFELLNKCTFVASDAIDGFPLVEEPWRQGRVFFQFAVLFQQAGA